MANPAREFQVGLALHEARLIRQALAEFTDPDEWDQAVIDSIGKKLFFAK